MKDSIEVVISRLKEEFNKELNQPKQGHAKKVFSQELKDKAISEAAIYGIHLSTIASELGIRASTLYSWKQRLRMNSSKKTDGVKSGSFKKVELGEEEQRPTQFQMPYLEAKSGVRIIGLSVNQMAELLRGL